MRVALISLLCNVAAGMMIKFYSFPNCIQAQPFLNGFAFSDICTSYRGNFDSALTTCNIDKKGNGTIEAGFFLHSQYTQPMCNTSVVSTLTAPGWGVCVNLPQNSMFLAASFMFGDPSEKIQCASTQEQGAVLVSFVGAAKECDALPYTIVDSVPTTTQSGCNLPSDGSSGFSVRAYYLSKKEKAISLTWYQFSEDCNGDATSWPSLPLDGSCHNSTPPRSLNGAFPCNPYPPKPSP
jgi:hypothetical protein